MIHDLGKKRIWALKGFLNMAQYVWFLSPFLSLLGVQFFYLVALPFLASVWFLSSFSFAGTGVVFPVVRSCIREAIFKSGTGDHCVWVSFIE